MDAFHKIIIIITYDENVESYKAVILEEFPELHIVA